MSRTPTRSLLAVALAGLLFAAGAQAQSYAGTEPVDRIAAVVNEDVILRSELERAVANIRAQYAGKEAQLPPAEVLGDWQALSPPLSGTALFTLRQQTKKPR